MNSEERLDKIIGDGIIDKGQRLSENIEAIDDVFDGEIDDNKFFKVLEDDFELLYDPREDDGGQFEDIYLACAKAARGNTGDLDAKMGDLGFSMIEGSGHNHIPKIYHNKNHKRYTFLVFENRSTNKDARIGEGLSYMISTEPEEGHELESKLKEFHSHRENILELDCNNIRPCNIREMGENLRRQYAITFASIYSGIGTAFATGNDIAGAITFATLYTLGNAIPHLIDKTKIKKEERICSEITEKIYDEYIKNGSGAVVGSNEPFDHNIVFKGYIATQDFGRYDDE